MNIMKLVDPAANTVEFGPEEGYSQQKETREEFHRTLNGNNFNYKFFQKGRWEVPVADLLKADADQINQWFDNGQELTFYDDTVNHPTRQYQVKLVNSERPLPAFRMPNWDNRFNGTLILAEE